MLVLAGAVPVDQLPLLFGPVELTGTGIVVQGRHLAMNRGNEAMMTAAALVCQQYGLEPPLALVAGDIGKRKGSLAIYRHLAAHLPEMNCTVLTLHYMMPDLKLHQEVMATVRCMVPKPLLIADAGSMYVAKASGDGRDFTVFTPDIGEIAFLADNRADHPAYTRGYIFGLDDDVPELIRRAYAGANVPQTLFVKGEVDYICHDGEILHTIDKPSIPAMEAIGGTGDLITGMISGLIHAGCSPRLSCRLAGQANRLAAELADPTPATQVQEILRHLPDALARAKKELCDSTTH